MRWFLRLAARARLRDLEPMVPPERLLPPQPYEGIAQMQREYGNYSVARWIEQRALFRRLSPGEQREQTERRSQCVDEALAWAASRPPGWTTEMIAAETGERIAHILGLPDDERLLARQFAAMMVELGPEETLCRIESSKDFDDRVRTALQLVLQTIVLGRRR